MRFLGGVTPMLMITTLRFQKIHLQRQVRHYDICLSPLQIWALHWMDWVEGIFFFSCCVQLFTVTRRSSPILNLLEEDEPDNPDIAFWSPAPSLATHIFNPVRHHIHLLAVRIQIKRMLCLASWHTSSGTLFPYYMHRCLLHASLKWIDANTVGRITVKLLLN